MSVFQCLSVSIIEFSVLGTRLSTTYLQCHSVASEMLSKASSSLYDIVWSMGSSATACDEYLARNYTTVSCLDFDAIKKTQDDPRDQE